MSQKKDKHRQCIAYNPIIDVIGDIKKKKKKSGKITPKDVWNSVKTRMIVSTLLTTIKKDLTQLKLL